MTHSSTCLECSLFDHDMGTIESKSNLLHKSEENLECAKLALKRGFFSSGASRCYYSIHQAMVYLFWKLTVHQLLSETDLDKVIRKGSHGEIPKLMSKRRFTSERIAWVNSAYALRRTADYENEAVKQSKLVVHIQYAETLLEMVKKECGGLI